MLENWPGTDIAEKCKICSNRCVIGFGSSDGFERILQRIAKFVPIDLLLTSDLQMLENWLGTDIAEKCKICSNRCVADVGPSNAWKLQFCWPCAVVLLALCSYSARLCGVLLLALCSYSGGFVQLFCWPCAAILLALCTL